MMRYSLGKVDDIAFDPLALVNSMEGIDGTNEYDLWSFVQNIDQIMRIVKCESCTESFMLMLVYHIRQKIHGQANRIAVLHSANKTWDELRKVLIESFGESCTFEQLLELAKGLSIKSAVKLYTEMENILRRMNFRFLKDCCPTDWRPLKNDAKLLTILKNKIEPEMAQVLEDHKVKTLEEAINRLTGGTQLSLNSQNANL